VGWPMKAASLETMMMRPRLCARNVGSRARVSPSTPKKLASAAGYDGFFADVVARLHVERRYRHPTVVRAMIEAATRFGTGAGGTRNIAGTNHPLIELEGELADLHGKEAALVFTSGYVSNQASIATIAKLIPDCLILTDALNHNSMIEGIRQSGMEKRIFRHNDIHHLEELLDAAGADRPKLIVFESLYCASASRTAPSGSNRRSPRRNCRSC
jgi:Aminotransferase class I and II